MNTSIPPFAIGQRVVAIVSHYQGAFSKGDEFIIIQLTRTSCCKMWLVDIGCKSWVNVIEHSCGIIQLNDNTWWFDATRFAPIHSNFQSITLSKILEEESKLISVN